MISVVYTSPLSRVNVAVRVPVPGASGKINVVVHGSLLRGVTVSTTDIVDMATGAKQPGARRLELELSKARLGPMAI